MANFKIFCLIQQPFYFVLPSTVTSIQGILPKTILECRQYGLMPSCLNGLDLCYILLSEKYSNTEECVFCVNLCVSVVACCYNFQERIREWPNATTSPHLGTFLQSHLYRFSSAMVTWYNISPHLLFSLFRLRDLSRQKWMLCVKNVKIGRVGVFWTGVQMYHCWATQAFSPVCPRVFVVAALFPFAGVSPLLRNEFHYLCLQVRFVRNVSSWREMKPGFYHGHVAYLDFSK